MHDEAVVALAVHALVALLRAQAGHLRQRFAQRDRVGVAHGVLLREALQLRQEDGPLPLGHAEVGADGGVVVEPAPALAAAVGVVPGGVQQGLVVADQRTALARGHELALLHREAPERAVAAGPATAPLGSVRMRAVLDQVQAPPLAERHEQVEITDRSRDVHRDDGARSLADRSLGGVGVDAERVGVDVDDHGRRVHGQNGARAGDERQARHDHLVALADAAGDERGLERLGAVRERIAGGGALVAREVAREAQRALAVARPPGSGVERGEQFLAFPLAPLRPRRIGLGVGDGCATEQCGQAHASSLLFTGMRNLPAAPR